MKRLFLHHKLEPSSSPSLKAKDNLGELKHATSSLRLKKGDRVLLLNGKGIEAIAQIKNIEKSGIDFFVESSRKEAPPTHKVTLIQGILKGQRCDWLVEKAVELGTHAIYFAKMEHSVCGAEDMKNRIPRWERLSCSALKQSGQLFLPSIKTFSSLKESVEVIEPGAISLYFHPQTPSNTLLKTLLKPMVLDSKQNIYLLLGPEGGFQEKELDLLTHRNYKSTSLGGYTLRGETAALVAASVVQQWLLFQRGSSNVST